MNPPFLNLQLDMCNKTVQNFNIDSGKAYKDIPEWFLALQMIVLPLTVPLFFQFPSYSTFIYSFYAKLFSNFFFVKNGHIFVSFPGCIYNSTAQYPHISSQIRTFTRFSQTKRETRTSWPQERSRDKLGSPILSWYPRRMCTI